MLNDFSNKNSLLIENLPEAFASFRMVYNREGKPVDAVFLSINQAFENMSGLKRVNLLSKFLTASIALIEAERNNLLDKLSQVVLTGKSVRLEHFAGQTKRWYEFAAYRYEPHCFAAIIRDVTEQKEEQAKQKYLSFHDSLTGLFNRHYLEAEMNRLDTARQLPIGVIMADIDGLKLVNDTFGYNSGDQVIRRAAEAIRKACRKEDIITRWGGDEFLIFLPQTTPEVVQDIGNRIIHNCRNVKMNSVPLSITLGAAAKLEPDQSLRRVQQVAEDRMQSNKLSTYRAVKSNFLKAVYNKLIGKSYESVEHIRRVKDMAIKLGHQLELPEVELKRLAVLVLLHDIGKVKIIEEILTKKGLLAPEEWEAIKRHPEAGSRIARATEEFAHIADDILSHHERWDGSGYPRGLKGVKIPLLARIMAISDAYEVMTRGRPYRRMLTPHQAVDELKRCAGTQFDPRLVETFIATLEEKVSR